MSNERASAIFDLLLHDLAENGHSLVPQEQIIRSFASLIEASKSKFEKVCRDHKELVLEVYGQDPDEAFSNINVLEIPNAMETMSLLALRDVERRLKREQKLREAADRKLKKLSKLEKYQSGNIRRKQKALQRERAAESRKRTKKGKKRRKKRAIKKKKTE